METPCCSPAFQRSKSKIKDHENYEDDQNFVNDHNDEDDQNYDYDQNDDDDNDDNRKAPSTLWPNIE